MKHRLVELDDPVGWSRALDGLSHAHAHAHAHVDAFARSAGDRTFLYSCTDDDGAPLVACPLSLRGAPGELDAYTPYGFSGFAASGDVPGFADEWSSFASEQGWVASYVFQHPMLTADLGFDASAFGAPTPCSVLDLTATPDELLARMSSRRRAELRRWMREPAKVTTDPAEALAFTIAIADEFFAVRDAAAAYRFVDSTWKTLLAAPSVWCIGVVDPTSSGCKVVALCIFGERAGLVDYLFGFSLPGASAHTAPLIWEAVHHFAGAGSTSMNLGGAVRAGDGVGEFKRRFGPTEVPARRVRLVHRSDAYAALCHRAGVDTDPSGFFPPYRRSST